MRAGHPPRRSRLSSGLNWRSAGRLPKRTHRYGQAGSLIRERFWGSLPQNRCTQSTGCTNPSSGGQWAHLHKEPDTNKCVFFCSFQVPSLQFSSSHPIPSLFIWRWNWGFGFIIEIRDRFDVVCFAELSPLIAGCACFGCAVQRRARRMCFCVFLRVLLCCGALACVWQ